MGHTSVANTLLADHARTLRTLARSWPFLARVARAAAALCNKVVGFVETSYARCLVNRDAPDLRAAFGCRNLHLLTLISAKSKANRLCYLPNLGDVSDNCLRLLHVLALSIGMVALSLLCQAVLRYDLVLLHAFWQLMLSLSDISATRMSTNKARPQGGVTFGVVQRAAA